MRHLLSSVSLVVWAYFVAMQLWLLALAIGSAVVLRRQRRQQLFGRTEDMLTSHLAPPVSIVVPAYNEAAGIVESIKSMSMVSYPRFEIVVANDGSTDDTLQKLIEAFDLYRPLPAEPTSAPSECGRSTSPASPSPSPSSTKRTAAGPTPSTPPSTPLATRTSSPRTPTSSSTAPHSSMPCAWCRRTANGWWAWAATSGRSTAAGWPTATSSTPRPDRIIERYQLLEYVRSFVASRPAWSAINGLPILSGAFGIWRRDVVVAVGGYTPGHLGEDLDLTMRAHRYLRDAGQDYRLVYSPAAVVWTEVPPTRKILRRQRIRWHRGLMTAVRDFRSSFFNPRHGTIGMVTWPSMVLFEYLAPIVEFCGWLAIPLALLTGAVPWLTAAAFFVLAILAGAITSLVALLLDERFGYFNDPRETLKLLTTVFVENLGVRQLTVWWRIRAMFGGRSTHQWGDMERRGVARLARSA